MDMVYEIEILKWEKHNITDRKLEWFKLSSDLIFNPKWDALNDSGKALYITLLALAALSGQSIVKVSHQQLAKLVKRRTDRLPSVIRLASEAQLIRVLNEPKIAREIDREKERKIGKKIQKPNSNQTSLSVIGDSTNPPSLSKKELKDLQKEKIKRKANIVIGLYAEAFKKFRGGQPTIDPKDIGQLMRLLDHHSEEKLGRMVQVYVQMKDPYFEKREFDLGTFIHNINKVGLAMQTGNDNDASDFDKFLRDAENEKAVTA